MKANFVHDNDGICNILVLKNFKIYFKNLCTDGDGAALDYLVHGHSTGSQKRAQQMVKIFGPLLWFIKAEVPVFVHECFRLTDAENPFRSKVTARSGNLSQVGQNDAGICKKGPIVLAEFCS